MRGALVSGVTALAVISAVWAAAPAAEPAAGRSGTVRIGLDRALGLTPLAVVCEVREGRVAEAIALAPQRASGWYEVDAAGLVIGGERLRGDCRAVLTADAQLPRHGRGSFVPGGEKLGAADIAVDLRFDGARGAGTYRLRWTPEGRNSGPFRIPPEVEGSCYALWLPPPTASTRRQIDLFCYAGLGGGSKTADPGITLRADLADGRSTALGVTELGVDDKTRSLGEARPSGAVSFSDGRLAGHVAIGEGPSAYALELEGRLVGRLLAGTVATARGGETWRSTFVGRVWDGQTAIPLTMPKRAWTWRHDAAPDAALAEAARAESLQPVLPGEPGQRGFWTWRAAVRSGVSSIRPPSFAFREVPGAASYRLTITAGKKGSEAVSFTVDKPWRPLGEVWGGLAPGEYALSVVALDAAGRGIGPAMTMDVIGQDGQPGERVFSPLKFAKRPAFAGPYTAAPSDLSACVLRAARAMRDVPRAPDVRGLTLTHHIMEGNEGCGSLRLAGQVWAALALRQHSTDAAELAANQLNLEQLQEAMRVNQRWSGTVFPEGIFFGYKAYTPLAHWAGEAVLDAWRETGDPRWRQMALRLGEGLAAFQVESGSWQAPGDGKKPSKPRGFFTWKKLEEFGAAELLHVLGRIRVDCQTDEFRAAEDKAWRWVEEHGIRGMNWPLHAPHSMSLGYPHWQSPLGALYVCRYLLDYAPAERRDVALVRDLAAWAEDVGVRWHRVEGEQTGGRILPSIPSADRQVDSTALTLMLALVYEKLSAIQPQPLLRAKADALLGAALQGQDPETGWLAWDLEPGYDLDDYHHALYGTGLPGGWSIRLLEEIAALRRRPAQDR